MASLKRLILAEVSPIVVSVALGSIFGYWVGLLKGFLLFVFVLLVLQPFVLLPLLRRGESKPGRFD